MTNPRYTDEHKVLELVREKFSNAESLSMRHELIGNEKFCLYSGQNTNGIGCAVGCLLEPEDAAYLDENYRNDHVLTIFRKEPEMMAKYFPDDWLYFLRRIQQVHDNSETVEEFLSQLKATYSRHM